MPTSLEIRNANVSKKLRLGEGKRIVTAWAENCSGPGWKNQIIWVLIQEVSGLLRQEALQPEDQTAGMRALFNVSDSATRALVEEINYMLRGYNGPSE